jgi:hypothetical protein
MVGKRTQIFLYRDDNTAGSDRGIESFTRHGEVLTIMAENKILPTCRFMLHSQWQSQGRFRARFTGGFIFAQP